MYINLLRVTLILSTIPIQTKISISKMSTKASSFFSKSKEEVIHQEFNNIKNVELTNIYGNITVESWKQPCVMIEQRKKGHAEFLKSCSLKTTVEDHTVHAKAEFASTNKGIFNIRILLPENISLKLKTNHGTITVKNHNGPMDLTTNYGNITVINGNNTTIAQTVQGNITVQKKSIKNDHCLNLQSEHGNITLMIPQELEADLEAHTNYGKITSELFVTLHSQTIQLNEQTFKDMKHHVHGWVGQPSCNENLPTILLKADYGAISILPYSNKKLKK